MSKRFHPKTGLGEILRSQRLRRGLPLRTVAAYLNIDQAILSRIERGERKATRDQVVKLAKYFNVLENELLVLWLSDRVLDEVAHEETALVALKVAEKAMEYRPSFRDKAEIVKGIRSVLKKDGRVAKAWLFGSVARDQSNAGSDVDLMIELNKKRKYSLFDLLDIEHLLEQKLKQKVDLVEKGYLRKFAFETAERDLIQIYG